MTTFFKNIFKNRVMLFMVLPGAIWFFFFSYLPLVGTVAAFKKYRFSREGFWASLSKSEWVGWDNFKFIFNNNDAFLITRNTLLYNLTIIALGLVFAVALAILLSELVNKRLAKLYQTGMFLPYFLSWVIVGYFVFSFLSMDRGMLNQLLTWLGFEPISWYAESGYWPYILVFVALWKSIGYNSIVYLASIMGIDRSLYEAAMIDGASKWQQIRNVTIPLLSPIIIIMTLLAVGRIFYADFGLFYQVPRDSGTLYAATNVIDTYVYRGLKTTGEIGMSTAAGLYQSVVGFVLVMISNYVVRRVDKDSSLF
ncbi:ABC transporter permease [Paenibacillus massiliensis]|uniref:ABC transporter permease n=1 Tax=Paenibacillus massiliensis TaxID=225917 RepID=UPI000373E6F2|nr:ABC transporter permease subunit [Paenibacillus massiliensis]